MLIYLSFHTKCQLGPASHLSSPWNSYTHFVRLPLMRRYRETMTTVSFWSLKCCEITKVCEHEARIHGIERRAKSFLEFQFWIVIGQNGFCHPCDRNKRSRRHAPSIIGGRFVRSSHHQHRRLLNILDFFSLSRFVDSYCTLTEINSYLSVYAFFDRVWRDTVILGGQTHKEQLGSPTILIWLVEDLSNAEGTLQYILVLSGICLVVNC